MNKRFSEIMYESERSIDDLHKKEREVLASVIPSLTTVGDSNRESFVDPKNIISFLQECIAPMMEACNKIDYNSIPQSIKDKGYELRSDIPTQVKKYYELNLQTIQRILKSMVDMIPDNLDDKEKIKADALILFRDRAIKMLVFIDKLVRAKTNLLLSKNKTPEDDINVVNKDYRFSNDLDETAIPLDSDHESFSVQYNTFVLIHCQVFLNYLAMYCTWFHQETYLYYYSPKSMNIDSEEFFSALMKMNDMCADAVVDRLNNKMDTIEKKQDKITNNQDELIKLVKNRNEIDAEKTGTLSVDQCIIIIGKIMRHYVEEKKRDCRMVGIPPEIIKMKSKKTIKRYIEYWDQYQNGNKEKGRKPPRKDYTRNMSIEDFSKWYNAYELGEYNKWKARNRIDSLSGKPIRRFGLQ